MDYLTKYDTTFLKERGLNVAQMDVFSRLMLDRIIYFSGGVTRKFITMVNAQLLYLSNSDGDNGRDIQMFINSPGGSVVDGLSVVDTIILLIVMFLLLVWVWQHPWVLYC